jgi:hypothetical protein
VAAAAAVQQTAACLPWTACCPWRTLLLLCAGWTLQGCLHCWLWATALGWLSCTAEITGEAIRSCTADHTCTLNEQARQRSSLTTLAKVQVRSHFSITAVLPDDRSSTAGKRSQVYCLHSRSQQPRGSLQGSVHGLRPFRQLTPSSSERLLPDVAATELSA